MNTAQPEKMKTIKTDNFEELANILRTELHPRIIAGINGTPAGVDALRLSLIRGSELVKNVKG